EWDEVFTADTWAEHVYDPAVDELEDSYANGDPPRLQRLRLDTLLRLDAPIRRIRDRIASWRRRGQRIPDEVWETAGDATAWRTGAEERARWLVVSTFNRATVDAGHQLAEAGEVAAKTWLCTHDARVRPAHLLADKQSGPLDGLHEVGGPQLRYPRAAAGPPHAGRS